MKDCFLYSGAELQGDVGEVLTACTLRTSCDMRIERHVYIPVNQHYIEIDMIGISSIGVFVIENKNYSGVIIGDVNEKYWKVKYPFCDDVKLYNPVMQNIAHKNAVLDYLKNQGYSNIPVFRPVIFNDKGVLLVKNFKKSVFTLSSFVNAYKSVSIENLDDELIRNLSSIFHKCSNVSQEMKEIHINLLDRGN